MNRSLNDAIQDIVRSAEERAMADLMSDDGLSKIAHVSSYDEYEDDGLEDRLEKAASALEWVAENVIKIASGHQHPGVGSGATKLQTKTPQDGKQSEETGKATNQAPERGLESHDGSGANAVHDNDADMRAFLQQEQPQISKAAQLEREALKARILAKTGNARKGNEPNISGSELSGPDGVSKSGEGPSAKGKGANLVSSIDKVINLTKGQAKNLVKEDLRKVLKEAPLSKATDPVLHNNLRNTSKAGVKIASLKDRFAAAKQEG